VRKLVEGPIEEEEEEEEEDLFVFNDTIGTPQGSFDTN
jgi:hypothetical protein